MIRTRTQPGGQVLGLQETEERILALVSQEVTEIRQRFRVVFTLAIGQYPEQCEFVFVLNRYKASENAEIFILRKCRLWLRQVWDADVSIWNGAELL